MPNWCENRVTVKHADHAMIQRAMHAFTGESFLQEFVPCPEELLHENLECYGPNAEDSEKMRKSNIEKYGFSSWYDWRISNWGTKWDIGGPEDSVDMIDNNTIKLHFDSAWSPPIEAYNKLGELGFEIIAYYNEPGIGFCGHYVVENQEGFHVTDANYSFDDNPENVRENIGTELDDEFGISESIKQYKEDNPEEE